jgi:hypothetical protein
MSTASAILTLGLALGAACLVGALRNVITHTDDDGDGLAKMSLRTGVSVESLSALRVAADLNDTSLQELRQAQSLLPLLNNLAKRGMHGVRDEAERLVVVMSGDAITAAEDFNDNLSRLKFVGEGMARSIAVP